MSMRFVGWNLVCVGALLASSTAPAQDTQAPEDLGTSTPPELRDFRLDTPPARNEPREIQPQPEPVPSPAQPPEERPSASPPTNRQPQTAQTQGAHASPLRNPSALPIVEPPIAEVTPDANEITSANEPAAAPIADAKSMPADEGGIPIEYSIIALGLLVILGGLATLFRRRRGKVTAEIEEQEKPEQPSPPVRLQTGEPRATAAFVPQSAMLSIASLTITGRLAVVNKTGSAIESLVIRSQMISAQPNQNEAIEAFHNTPDAGSIQSLGALAKGETIDALIEIRLPRIELASYRWTEREFVAPIILINISGQADGHRIELRLSELIGRIGAGGAARMKPLAVDRGPKRFTGVTAKPLFA